MNHFLIRISCLLVLGMFLVPSCKNTLDVTPANLVPVQNMWKVKNDARAAVFATYGLLRAALANENAYLAYGELRAGDFKSVSRTDLQAVTGNNLQVGTKEMEEWKSWRRFYAVIAQANLCIENLEKVGTNDFRYTPDILRLDIAHVRFLRSLAYFYLARIWGDVPLITQSPKGDVITGLKREAQRKVLDFAKQDALAALNDLPWRYDGSFPEQRGSYWEQSASHWQGNIASKGAACELVAHISACTGNYLDTEKYSKLAIDNKGLAAFNSVTITTLTATDGGTFSGKAANVIFALPFNKDYQESSASGHIEDWTLSSPYISRQLPDMYVPNDSILQIFSERSDQRFNIGEGGAATGTYFTGFGSPVPQFSKVRQLVTTGADPLKSFQSAIVIFRYEELVLLRAEALLFLGSGQQAIQLLNSVRTARGLAEFKSTDGPLADAILAERRRELLGEGWRWFDLIRFEKIPGYTGITDADINNGALYWPLSKDVLAGNTSLIQNKFWQR